MDKEIRIQDIEWQAPEYIQGKKSVDRFWAIGLIALAIAILGIYFQNYVFAILILISGGALILLGVREPEIMNCEINQEGIRIGRRMYSYRNIKGFMTKDGSPFGKLILEIDTHFLPIVSVQIPEDMANQIKAELSQIIEEKELKESIALEIMERLGF